MTPESIAGSIFAAIVLVMGFVAWAPWRRRNPSVMNVAAHIATLDSQPRVPRPSLELVRNTPGRPIPQAPHQTPKITPKAEKRR